MLKNQQNSKELLKYILPFIHQQRLIQQQSQVLFNKNTDVFRQGKIMGKLFGHRLSGSKKRWFPSNTDSTQAVNANIMIQQSQIVKPFNSGGKSAARRTSVLNKLFMKHITDLMATGEISERVLGKGLQISRVKISPDFAYISVFWLPSGEVAKDDFLENELQCCSGLLRHELSQLGLMGVVPRIKFVKDKMFTNMMQVEALLKDMNFGTDEEDASKVNFNSGTIHKTETLKQEFYGCKTNDVSTLLKDNPNESDTSFETLDNMPEMRHDVLGLDHKGIMLKICTKMRKSKQAWDQHFANSNSTSNENSSIMSSSTFKQLAKNNEKLAETTANAAKFDAFLAKRKEKRKTPERKKFRASDHIIEEQDIMDERDNTELMEFTRRHKLFETDDYLLDEMEDRKHD